MQDINQPPPVIDEQAVPLLDASFLRALADRKTAAETAANRERLQPLLDAMARTERTRLESADIDRLYRQSMKNRFSPEAHGERFSPERVRRESADIVRIFRQFDEEALLAGAHGKALVS